MPHYWPIQKMSLRHFSPREFDHPDRMDKNFLLLIDEWADRVKQICDVSIIITDDFRTPAEQHKLYPNGGPDSAHLRGRAIDFVLKPDSERAQLACISVATNMYFDSKWPHLGVEVATRHLHLDSDDELAKQRKRPVLFAAASK